MSEEFENYKKAEGIEPMPTLDPEHEEHMKTLMAQFERYKSSEEGRREQRKKEQARLSRLARLYPWEFVQTLLEDATETMRNWLEANHAPDELVKLYNGIRDLAFLAPKLEHGESLNDFDSEWLVEAIAETTGAIATMGGVFHSCASVSIPRKNVVTWQPVQAGAQE